MKGGTSAYSVRGYSHFISNLFQSCSTIFQNSLFILILGILKFLPFTHVALLSCPWKTVTFNAVLSGNINPLIGYFLLFDWGE